MENVGRVLLEVRFFVCWNVILFIFGRGDFNLRNLYEVVKCIFNEKVVLYVVVIGKNFYFEEFIVVVMKLWDVFNVLLFGNLGRDVEKVVMSV